MKLIKNILARILAIWALIVFASTMMVFFPFYMVCFILPDPQKTRYHRFLSQIWMGAFLLLSGCTFKVTGKEVFDGLENAVVVCNHNSLIDIPVSTPFLARANKTIAKKSFVYVPLFGWIYQFATVIVDRKNNESRRKSYEEMKRVLKNNPLKSFYDGAFRLSVDTGKPIVPVVILNTKRILPAKPILFLRPGKIILNILPAISPAGHTSESLKNLVFDIMAEHYDKNNKS
ncbi:MAG: 1-acyl-sn-glycerol-3-phosphate acyltransferase [Chitinophagia bacterium]|nr:1-acyl-sn-glycerol-3-phosphate acyltransferase [Chitinophagia bacterium]